jgi:hypothetical protein
MEDPEDYDPEDEDAIVDTDDWDDDEEDEFLK